MTIDAPPRFGAICRGDAHPGPLVILGARGDLLEAAPLTSPLDTPSLWIEASGLEVFGEDLPAARVLAMRRRAARACDDFERVNGRLPGDDDPGAAPPAIGTAMVFCAGLGTRLRPLTARFPKPAVPFFGAPLLRYTLAWLKGAGVGRVVINTHHLPEVMAEVARDEAARRGIELAISHEPILMDTAGGLREARRLIGEVPFVVVNGDAFLSLDLPALIARHQRSGALATLAVTPPVPGETFRAIEADATGRVARIRGIGEARAGLSPWHFLGVHVVEPALLDAIAPDGPRDINGETYPSLIARGALVEAVPARVGAWADLGTPRRYLDACEDLVSGRCDLSPLGRAAPVAPQDERVFGQGSARAFIDRAARLGRGVTVEGAVIGPDVEIGRGARIVRAALLPGTRVAAGELVEDEIRWPGGAVRVGS